MMQNRHEQSSTLPEGLDGDTLTTVESHVKYCLANREGLGEVIGELRTAKLRGESVQSELNDLFERESSLALLAGIDDQHGLSEVLDALRDHGDLAATEVDQFADWWASNDWIVEGIDAFSRAQMGVPYHWTEKNLGFDGARGRLLVEHRLAHGVDDIHRIRVPAEKLFVDSVDRLQAIIRVLPTAVQRGDLGPEAVGQILEQQENLEQVAEALEEFTQVVEAVLDEEVSGEPSATDADQTALEAMFEQADDDTSSEPDQAIVGFE